MMRFCLVWASLFFCALLSAQPSQRMSPSLGRKLKELNPGDSVKISVSFRRSNPQPVVPISLKPVARAIYRGWVSRTALEKLALDSSVLLISETQQAKEELNTGAVDYTLNKVNLARLRFPALTGDSVFAFIKERSFDTTDIDLIGRVFTSGIQAPAFTSHASVMATIVAGAGNSSPTARGVAPGTRLGSSDFANLFPAPDGVYRQKSISVENHSYGTVVENFYGNEAAAHDASTHTIPGLLHIFSAGNSGTATPASGNYNGLAGVANLTGNFKQSKNSLSVSALDSAGTPMIAASKGPAYDGRLKPELAAYGEDGSSGAAALVSGSAVLVQDAFKKQKGILPPADFVKAVLINSADDAGFPGIDFVTGYGSLNVAKAVEAVVENRFFAGAVSLGETKSFGFVVPPNVSKLKVTLAWTDTAATPNAQKALLNDLDLRLVQGSAAWLPWVLNASPNLALLQAPAERKVDTLNVVEQITLNNPAPGNYAIEVKASKLATATQSFSLVYQFDTADVFSWTFPTVADPLVAGRSHRLRWQTTLTGAGEVEFATSGANWRSVGPVSNLAAGNIKWLVPDTVTTAVLRLRLSNGFVALSDTFVVAPVLQLQTGFNCPDSFLLYWNSMPARAYSLLHLNGNYLQPFRQQTDTALVLRKGQTQSVFFSVAPLVGSLTGLRSQTVSYTAQAVGCYIKTFFLQNQVGGRAFFTAEIGTLYNVQEVALERLTNNGFVTVQAIAKPASLSFSFGDSLPTQGENRYRFRVKLANGTLQYSGVEVVYYLPENPVVLYPNPALQQSSIRVLTNEVGRYTLIVFDAQGRKLHTQALKSSISTLLALRLAKGLYFVRISDAQGKSFTQKLVVY